VTKVSTSADWK